MSYRYPIIQNLPGDPAVNGAVKGLRINILQRAPGPCRGEDLSTALEGCAKPHAVDSQL